MSLGTKIWISIAAIITTLLPALVFMIVWKIKTKSIFHAHPQNAETQDCHQDIDQTGAGLDADGTPVLIPQAFYHKISPEEAKKWIEMDNPAFLIDVRTREEYMQERIAGNIFLPETEIVEQSDTRLPDKDAKIIVYCHSGVRSKKAANLLVSLGYTNVYDMGGIISWPYETVQR